MSNPEQIGRVRDLIIRQTAMITALEYSIFNAFLIILFILTATKRQYKTKKCFLQLQINHFLFSVTFS